MVSTQLRHRPITGRHVRRALGASALAVMAMIAAAAPSHAQQTFECEDGGSVTVLPGQLELMKRSDPCVARHFGGAADGEAPLNPAATYDEEAPPASYDEAAPADPYDRRGPYDQGAPANTYDRRGPYDQAAPYDGMAPAAPVSPLAPTDAPLPERKPDELMADASTGGAPAAPAPEVKSDYRHVHIINARSGTPQFYEHTR